MHDLSMGEMTSHRSMASLPIGGRYRMVDFALSSMVNAGMTKVGVIAKSNYQSLLDHLENGRAWDLARKREGLAVFPPHSYYGTNESVYHGRIEALSNILTYIEASNTEYVVMMDCDYLCNLDLKKVMREHTENGADITIVCCNLKPNEEIVKNCVAVKSDENGRVKELMLNRCDDGFRLSMNIFIIRKDLLAKMIADAASRMLSNFERDVLINCLSEYNVHAYVHEGYVTRMYSLDSYFDASMGLLNPQNLNALFPAERPVYTKVRDEAPVRYGVNSKVSNCLVADGCVIEGEIENCVLFRGVKIKKGAVVKNCILMQETVVGENASLQYIISDKDVKISDGRSLVGQQSYPVYIRKAVTV